MRIPLRIEGSGRIVATEFHTPAIYNSFRYSSWKKAAWNPLRISSSFIAVWNSQAKTIRARDIYSHNTTLTELSGI
jgi:hypothetical protein